jgi:histone-lysine N-methyltransferase SETD2
LKRYKLNKEKLKREKELVGQQSKKHTKEKRHKSTIKLKMKEMTDSNSETAKKIKESFRSNMATVVVSVLNSYRKPDCKEGRITNTDDFKHLARKVSCTFIVITFYYNYYITVNSFCNVKRDETYRKN